MQRLYSGVTTLRDQTSELRGYAVAAELLEHKDTTSAEGVANSGASFNWSDYLSAQTPDEVALSFAMGGEEYDPLFSEEVYDEWQYDDLEYDNRDYETQGKFWYNDERIDTITVLTPLAAAGADSATAGAAAAGVPGSFGEELGAQGLAGYDTADWVGDASYFDYPDPEGFLSSYLEEYEAAKAADAEYWADTLSSTPAEAAPREAAATAAPATVEDPSSKAQLIATYRHHRKVQQLGGLLDAITDLFTPGTPTPKDDDDDDDDRKTPAPPKTPSPAPTKTPTPAPPKTPSPAPPVKAPAVPSPAKPPATTPSPPAVNATGNGNTTLPVRPAPPSGVVLPNGTNATTLDVPVKDVNSSVKLMPTKDEEKEVMQKLEQQVAEAQAANRAQPVRVQMDLIGEFLGMRFIV
jgi:hypothetical protein